MKFALKVKTIKCCAPLNLYSICTAKMAFPFPFSFARPYIVYNHKNACCVTLTFALQLPPPRPASTTILYVFNCRHFCFYFCLWFVRFPTSYFVDTEIRWRSENTSKYDFGKVEIDLCISLGIKQKKIIRISLTQDIKCFFLVSTPKENTNEETVINMRQTRMIIFSKVEEGSFVIRIN